MQQRQTVFLAIYFIPGTFYILQIEVPLRAWLEFSAPTSPLY